MDIKIKTTLIILFTFIIGMVAGAIITRAFFKYRMEKVLSMSVPSGFAAHFERIIDPTDEQRESVRKILNKYGQQMFQMRQKSLKEFFSINQAMQTELNSILTPEQRKRLEERFFRNRPGRFFGPTGDGPPHPPWQNPPPDREGKPGDHEASGPVPDSV
jgi:hypothetical protein